MTIHTNIEDILAFIGIAFIAAGLWRLRQWLALLWIGGWFLAWAAMKAVRVEKTEADGA